MHPITDVIQLPIDEVVSEEVKEPPLATTVPLYETL